MAWQARRVAADPTRALTSRGEAMRSATAMRPSVTSRRSCAAATTVRMICRTAPACSTVEWLSEECPATRRSVCDSAAAMRVAEEPPPPLPAPCSKKLMSLET
jgi:hypothetical protein